MRLPTLLGLTLAATAMAGCATAGPRYPCELEGYRFWEAGRWQELTPLVSTISDVRRVMGHPAEEVDLGNYGEPYPGDDLAGYPLLKFRWGDDWEILIYFVRTNGTDWRNRDLYPGEYWARVMTIDFLPVKTLPFDAVSFPQSFRKRHVSGADAGWDEYTDGSGLVYKVYSGATAYGDEQRGDLNRISYGPTKSEAESRQKR